MVAASKRVLVIGPEKGLAAVVAQELDAGSMPVSFICDRELDWTDSAAVDHLLQSQGATVLLNEIDFSAIGEGDGEALLHRNRNLAAASRRQGCIALHLSDYHVFGADTKNAYDENDPVAPLDSFGSLVAELEQAFAKTVEHHLILRFSWLVDAEDRNLFTRILSALTAGEQLSLSRYRRGAPTWRSDARRVISGVVRQVAAGARNWGHFHYCSSDSCNEWEFGQEVEATLQELQAASGSIVAEDVKAGTGYPLEPASATLNTRRIRDNFGVHGRSWRQGLKGQVSQWLDRQGQPFSSAG